jgi:hypothetical protein
VQFAGRDRVAFIEVKPTWAKAPEDYLELIQEVLFANEPDCILILEVHECAYPVICLPPTWGADPLHCFRWAAEDNFPSLRAMALQVWLER